MAEAVTESCAEIETREAKDLTRELGKAIELHNIKAAVVDALEKALHEMDAEHS